MTEMTLEDLSLTVSRLIPAPRERVFDAWLDPKMMAKFMKGKPDTTISRIETDPRLGGRFTVVMHHDRDIVHEGTYREIVRPERLVFTWESEFSRDDSTITLSFETAEGGTLVTLTQERFMSEALRDGHREGWSHILGLLSDTFRA